MSKVSMFKRIEDKLLLTEDNTFQVKGKYYGKMLKFKLMGRAIRGYNANLVYEQLGHKGGKYATIVQKLIGSCIANANYNGLDKSRLYVKSLSVGPGTYLKRREFKGRGRSGAIWRPYSNIVLQLKGVELGK